MKQKTLIKIAIAITMTALIAVTLTKMWTQPVDLTLTQTIQMPELSNISELSLGDSRAKAVSLDGRVIGQTNTTSMPTASTAKMILGLAVMEKKPFSLGEKGEMITITPEFYDKYLWYINHNGSTTKVEIMEEISQYDALASVFLASSNNLADTLAIWAFGSLDSYRNYATEMLSRLGITNTTIGQDASGYSETTTSTAGDLSVIAAEVLKNPVLKEIVGLRTYTIPVAGLITNTNKILGEPLGSGSSVIGVKTGYIGDTSGYNLVSAYEYDDHLITLALLGASSRSNSFEESKKELSRLSEELKTTTIVSSGEVVGYYETWWNGKHSIKATEDISTIAILDDDNRITLTNEGIEVVLNGKNYHASTTYDDFATEPTVIERFLHLFGWTAE